LQGVAETGLAAYAILGQDGEILEGTAQCGQELDCILVPGSVPGGYTGFIQGNTLVIDSDRFPKRPEFKQHKFLGHESKHAEDVASIGYLAWIGSYLVESAYEVATGGDPYRDVTWEERARRASNAPNDWTAF
jgi:hypothetical protein